MEEKIQIKRLGPRDAKTFCKLIELFKEVFETETLLKSEESYLTRLLEKPDFIAYVVAIEGEIVGGLTAYELTKYYSADSEVFIYDIAIRAQFQRKGLGKRLLSSLNEYCKQKGIKVIFVAANEEDEQAVNFYHSTNGYAEKVIHFNYTIN